MNLKIQIRIKDVRFFGQKPWADTMNRMRGQWVDVETEYLFPDQFNVAQARVPLRHVVGIRFIDCTFEQFERAVLERYNLDWPGTQDEVAKKLKHLRWMLSPDFHELTYFGDKLVYLPTISA